MFWWYENLHGGFRMGFYFYPLLLHHSKINSILVFVILLDLLIGCVIDFWGLMEKDRNCIFSWNKFFQDINQWNLKDFKNEKNSAVFRQKIYQNKNPDHYLKREGVANENSPSFAFGGNEQKFLLDLKSKPYYNEKGLHIVTCNGSLIFPVRL